MHTPMVTWPGIVPDYLTYSDKNLLLQGCLCVCFQRPSCFSLLLAGVGPGIIVGILIAGILAVVIIAVIYAKYKQRRKNKMKGTNALRQNSAARPGKQVVVGPEIESRISGGSAGYDGPGLRDKTRSPSSSDQHRPYAKSNSGSRRPVSRLRYLRAPRQWRN